MLWLCNLAYLGFQTRPLALEQTRFNLEPYPLKVLESTVEPLLKLVLSSLGPIYCGPKIRSIALNLNASSFHLSVLLFLLPPVSTFQFLCCNFFSRWRIFAVLGPNEKGSEADVIKLFAIRSLEGDIFFKTLSLY